MLRHSFLSAARAYGRLPYGPRIFVGGNGIGMFFSAIALLFSLANGNDAGLLLNGLGILLCGSMTILGLRTERFTLLFGVFGFLMVALLSAKQITHDGYSGYIPPLMLLIVVLLLTIADVRQHKLVILFLLLTMCALYLVERNFPELLGEYPGETERRAHVFVAMIMSALAIWGLVTGLRRGFEVERARLREANLSVRRSAQRLRRAQSDAEHATRARKNFLSTMSHEIRTPLNSIIGMAHLLQDESLSDDNRNSVKTIRFSAEHLLSLINDILDYSRLDSGVIEPEMRPLAVRKWLEGLLETFRVTARENQTRLRLVLPPADEMPESVISDAPRLTQILTNLLSNAIKFTAQGEVVLNVRTRRLTDTTWDLCFEVRDNGVGIAPDRLDGIFDEFTQAESDTYREFGGTGLGLAIVRRLVDLFGGEVRVESTPGQGTCFIVELALGVLRPDSQEYSADRPTGPESVSALPGKLERLEGRRALIVEDYEMNRLIAERFLGRWGMETVAVESGAGALEFIADASQPAVDIVLMDIQMPGIDGYETTREMRAAGGPWAEVPIIALSAASLPEEREAAYAAGMDDYVAKPFRPDDLRDALLRRL